MHRLSIVIPCPVMDQRTEDTLVSVLENRPAHSEVIVVTAGKYADPYDLSGEVKFVEDDPTASLVRLMNTGAEVSSADVVHILLPGTKAVEAWVDRVLPHFEDPRVAAVSPVLVRAAADDRAALLGVSYRESGIRRLIGKNTVIREASQVTALAPSCHAGFYRRDVLAALDGFDESMSEDRADVEFGLAIRQLGYRTVVETESRVVVERIALPCRSHFRAGRQLERLYRRYSIPGAWIAFLHCLVFAADVLVHFPRPGMVARLLGRVSAWCEPRIQRRQHERVHRAQAHLARIVASQATSLLRHDGPRERGRSQLIQRRAA